MILSRKKVCFRFIYLLLCLLPISSAHAQLNHAPTVILQKKRILHLKLVRQQIQVTAENLLVIRHGTQRANLSAIERIGYSKFNKLLTVKAFTVTPKGDTLHVTRFSDQSTVHSGVFYDDYMERTFLFPGAINGATSYLHYTEELSEPRFLGAYYFNAPFPVRQSEFQIHCDKQIKMAFSTFNAAQVLFEEKKQRKKWLYTWKAVDVPVFQKREGEPEISYRAPHVIPRIAYYSISDRLKIPLLSNVADLYAWYGGLVAETDADAADYSLKRIADSLTAGLKTPEAKARAIFKWVQQNIQYIAFEDGYGGLIPRKAADVLRKRYGDCKDMTALLVALMKRVGIEAYFTWIGTRRLPYRYTELPTPMVDNHMIATIQINNQLLFLDATDPELPFGMPSSIIQGKEALIGKSRYAYEIRTVPTVDARQSVLKDSAVITFSSTDTVKVTGGIIASGYFKHELHNKQPLFNSRNIMTEAWKVQSPTADTVKQASYACALHQAIIQQRQQVYFNPHTLTTHYQEKWLPPAAPFKHWELEYAFTLIHKQFIRLPQGWEVASLPPDVAAKYPNFGFSVCYEKKTDGIAIARTVFVNILSINADSISEWQQFSEAYNLAVRQNIIFNLITK